MHIRLVNVYLLNVPSVSGHYFNKIKRTSHLGKWHALSLEILIQYWLLSVIPSQSSIDTDNMRMKNSVDPHQLHQQLADLDLNVFIANGRNKLVWPRKYAHSSFSSLVQSSLPKDTLVRTYSKEGKAHMVVIRP